MEYFVVLFGFLLGALFVLGGIHLLHLARKEKLLVKAAKKWPQVMCEITESKVVETYDEKSMYHAELEYKYKIGIKEYYNYEVSIGGIKQTSNQKYIQDICDKYPTHSMHHLSYNPDDPEESYLDPVGGLRWLNIFGGIVFFIAGLIILWTFFGLLSGVSVFVRVT